MKYNQQNKKYFMLIAFPANLHFRELIQKLIDIDIELIFNSICRPAIIFARKCCNLGTTVKI